MCRGSRPSEEIEDDRVRLVLDEKPDRVLDRIKGLWEREPKAWTEGAQQTGPVCSGLVRQLAPDRGRSGGLAARNHDHLRAIRPKAIDYELTAFDAADIRGRQVRDRVGLRSEERRVGERV